MRISFTPALETTSYVPAATLCDSQCVVFTARVNADEFKAQSGSRIEVWSDIQGGRGEWGAVPFEMIDEAKPLTSDSDASFSLVPSSTPKTFSRSNEVVLQARFVIPNAGQDRYQFTYRVAHPNGSYIWLGRHGRNGLLIPSRTPFGWIPKSGWKSGEEEGNARWENGKGAVGSLGPDTAWKGWALTQNGPVRFISPEDLTVPASLIVLFPTTAQGSLIYNLPFFLYTGSQSSITVNSAQEFILSGSDPLQIRLLTHPAILLAVIDEHIRPSHWSMHSSNSPHFVVTSSSLSTNKTISILPISPVLTESTSMVVNIPPVLLSGGDDDIVMFSRTTRKATTSPSSVLVDKSGGEVTITSSLTLEDGPRNWILSVISSNATNIKLVDEPVIAPAPPPAEEATLPAETILTPPPAEVTHPLVEAILTPPPVEAILTPPPVEAILTPPPVEAILTPPSKEAPLPPPSATTKVTAPALRMLDMQKSQPESTISLPGFLLLLMRIAAIMFSILFQYLHISPPQGVNQHAVTPSTSTEDPFHSSEGDAEETKADEEEHHPTPAPAPVSEEIKEHVEEKIAVPEEAKEHIEEKSAVQEEVKVHAVVPEEVKEEKIPAPEEAKVHAEEKPPAVDLGHAKPLVFEFQKTGLGSEKVLLFLQGAQGSVDDVAFHIDNQIVKPLTTDKIGTGQWLVELDNEGGRELKVALV